MAGMLNPNEVNMDTIFTKNRKWGSRPLRKKGQKHDPGFKKAQRAREIREIKLSKINARLDAMKKYERLVRRIAQKRVQERGSTYLFGNRYNEEVNREIAHLKGEPINEAGKKRYVSDIFSGVLDFPREIRDYAGRILLIEDPEVIAEGGKYKMSGFGEYCISLENNSGLVQLTKYQSSTKTLAVKKVNSGMVTYFLRKYNNELMLYEITATPGKVTASAEGIVEKVTLYGISSLRGNKVSIDTKLMQNSNKLFNGRVLRPLLEGYVCERC